MHLLIGETVLLLQTLSYHIRAVKSLYGFSNHAIFSYHGNIKYVLYKQKLGIIKPPTTSNAIEDFRNPHTFGSFICTIDCNGFGALVINNHETFLLSNIRESKVRAISRIKYRINSLETHV